MLTRRHLLAFVAALCVSVACAFPASAAQVTVVDGGRTVVREDPFAPGRAETSLGPPPGRPRAAAAAPPQSHRGRRAVERALVRAARRLGRRYGQYTSDYRNARLVHRRLRGLRAQQLGYVIGSIERIALRGQLSSTRIPVLFVQLRRNTQYWPSRPFPRADVTFLGSEILYRYFPGRGLQIHPLATFKKANLMYGACRGSAPGPCRQPALARLLDEMGSLAVDRGRGKMAWEYLFDFGGGAPPWISGMAQATGIQAFARASQLLGRTDYLRTADRALGVFETPPPAGVRVLGPGGGVHYLQYSFAPRLYIFNAFFQALNGLYDYSQIAPNSRAGVLLAAAEPEGRLEVPLSDTGSWSRYSYRGRTSTGEYHELLREVLQGLCNRLRVEPYCTYARRYRSYQQTRSR